MNLNPTEPGKVYPQPNPCAPSCPWFPLLRKRKPRLTLQGKGAPGTLGHVLLEPGAGELQPQRPRPVCARHSPRDAQPATPRYRPASRDRRGGRAPPRTAPGPAARSRRGRLPETPSGQQGLTQVRAQLAQRRLRVWHLQRPGPLL